MNKILFAISCLLNISIFASGLRDSGKFMGSGSEPIIINLESPRSGWTQDRMVLVKGTISDLTVHPVAISVNGDRYFIHNKNGAFSRSFPVSAGKNNISVIAKNKTGVYKVERNLFANFSPTAIKVVLTSDTDNVYTDLHIYEPNASSLTPYSEIPTEHIYWAKTASPSGGKFYLNNQSESFDYPGFGPYLYTHAAPPLGIYRIDANYYPSGDRAHILATLNIVLFGGSPTEIKRVVKVPLIKKGDTKTLAWVKIEKNMKAEIFVPGIDKYDDKIWPEFVKNDTPAKSQDSYGD